MAFFAPKMPVTFLLISVLASRRDFGQIRRLQYARLLRAGIGYRY